MYDFDLVHESSAQSFRVFYMVLIIDNNLFLKNNSQIIFVTGT
jgi:hypothetical protein